MKKRMTFPLVLLSAAIVMGGPLIPGALAQSGAPPEYGSGEQPFVPDGERDGGIVTGPSDRPAEAPKGPTSRTPRLSPIPGEPKPPSPDARALDQGKEQADSKAAPPPDTPSQRRRALDDLYAHLAASDNFSSAVPLATAIERLWLYSGSDTIDVLMERVLKSVAEQRLDLAEKLAATIVELEPGFAEGWNRRALVAYLQGDTENALNALTRALALEPSHFKALDGLAQVMRQRGDKAAALKAYRKLLEVHPYWEGAKDSYDELKREVEGDGI